MPRDFFKEKRNERNKPTPGPPGSSAPPVESPPPPHGPLGVLPGQQGNPRLLSGSDVLPGEGSVPAGALGGRTCSPCSVMRPPRGPATWGTWPFCHGGWNLQHGVRAMQAEAHTERGRQLCSLTVEALRGQAHQGLSNSPQPKFRREGRQRRASRIRAAATAKTPWEQERKSRDPSLPAAAP